LKVIRKFVKNIDDTLALTYLKEQEKLSQEKQILGLICKQLSSVEIEIVSGLVKQGKTIKNYAFLKRNTPGRMMEKL
jgi:hypothetical protein